MAKNTLTQFDEIIAECRELFQKKNADYGPSWRILRPCSITDQLLIKAKRIRTIEEKGESKVSDSIDDDYMGLINYSIMALIQLSEVSIDATVEDDPEWLSSQYDLHVETIRALLDKKNHDYGEVWRDMRRTSITDLILMKLLRVKRIENNQGKTLVSEGLEANYMDIINYSVFALIKLREG